MRGHKVDLHPSGLSEVGRSVGVMFVFDESEVNVEMLDGSSVCRGKTEEASGRVEKGVPVREGSDSGIGRSGHGERSLLCSRRRERERGRSEREVEEGDIDGGDIYELVSACEREADLRAGLEEGVE